MKRINHICGIAYMAMLLLLQGCAQEQKDAPQLLEFLPAEVIEFEHQGGTQLLPFTTNSQEVSAFSEGSWIVATIEGSNLKLEVSPNEKPSDRQATVHLLINNKMRSVTIAQLGKPEDLEARLNNISFYHSGGIQRFAIRKSDINWTATASTDWIKVQKVSNNTIQVEVSQNDEETAREGKVVFIGSLGQQLPEVVAVHQEGVPNVFIPSTQWHTQPAVIRAFEEGRGNPVYKIPDNFLFHTWGFRVPGKYFNLMEYFFGTSGYHKACLYVRHDNEVAPFKGDKGDEIIAFLKANGFERDVANENLFRNPNTHMEAEFIMYSQELRATPHIRFQLYYPQPEPYETLTIEQLLGLYNEYDGNNKPKHPAEDEYEKSTGGGRLDESLSSTTYRFYWCSSPWIFREYDLNRTSQEVFDFFGAVDKIEYALYEDPYGSFHLTEEFKNLMAENDFKLTWPDPGRNRYTFTNTKRGLAVRVYLAKNKNVDYKQTLHFKVNYL